MNDKDYEWVPFYEKLADKLLTYKDKRSELFELMKKKASEQPLMQYLHFERDEWWGQRGYNIDPFSVMGVMNRGTTSDNRTNLAKELASAFGIGPPAPISFTGVPVLDNRKSFFAGMDELWRLFALALNCADTGEFNDEFKSAFDKAVAVKGNGLTYITMGLYWIRPNYFMPLDGNSRAYVFKQYGITVPIYSCSGEAYVSLLKELKNKIDEKTPDLTFPEISYLAWSQKEKPSEYLQTNAKDTEKDEKKISGAAANVTTAHQNKFGSEKNILLYGTPGTGKTYSTVKYAVSIIEEKPLDIIEAEDYDAVFARYLTYKKDNLIAFTTFHQSYGYEEFIEGIRPVISSDGKETIREIEYEVHDGIFKEFCNNAGTPVNLGKSVDLGFGKKPSVWKVSLEGTGDNPTRSECMKNNHIRIGYDVYGDTISDSTDYSKDGGGKVLNAFYNRMQIGDIVFSCYSSKTIDAIGVITGEPEWHDEFPRFKRLRKVNWIALGLNEDITDLNAGCVMSNQSVYKMSVSASDAINVLKKVKPDVFNNQVKIPNRVFIIDEINRGNISKVFGELITLIEPSKRIGEKEELRSILPYSKESFGVPSNVYLIGTMNTADRSIALMDTALRRRFSFVEMQPKPALLDSILVENTVNIAKMLEIINKRITVLYDREHTIGHSYFMPLRDDPSIERLAEIFKSKIIPLLQEYFYDDYEKISLVLGDNQKPDDSTRFIIKKDDAFKLFGSAAIDYSEYYEINSPAFNRIDAYAFL